MDNITDLVRTYADFFYQPDGTGNSGERILTLPLSKALGWAKEILPDLHPNEISVNLLPEHIREEIIEIMEDSPEQLLMDARYLYLEQFISQAFFYYFLIQSSLGHDRDEINEMAIQDFNITGEYKIYKPPQHRNKYASRKTSIFLDWDDTIDTGESGSIREKFNEFIAHYRKSNYVTTGHSYSLVVTSASVSLEEKLKRLDEDLIHGLDAVYTVPACTNWVPDTGNLLEHETLTGYYRQEKFGIGGVARLVTPDMHNAVLGKLYTDVSQQLDVDPEHAIIITDQFADQSADKSIPLVTLVVSRDDEISPEVWIRAIHFLENKGDFNIYHGANRLTWGLQRPRGNYEFRRYKAADGLELYRTPRFPNCFFLGHPPEFQDGIIRF